jgi:hypothetical protein
MARVAKAMMIGDCCTRGLGVVSLPWRHRNVRESSAHIVINAFEVGANVLTR